MIAEKTAGILERVRLVKDEAILDAVTHLLDTYLSAQDAVEATTSKIRDFDPLKYHSPEEIASFEARDDFMGYGIDGRPLYGSEVVEIADREIAAIQRGEANGTSLEELKAKTARWLTPTK